MDPTGNVASGVGCVGFETSGGRKIASWVGDSGDAVPLRVSAASEEPPEGDQGWETVGVVRLPDARSGLPLWAG